MTIRTLNISTVPLEIRALGFGCSSLTGTSRRNALRLLAASFDGGVRHFDVARYYGYGECEGILGTFARSRRSQITITSKFGIQPPSRKSAMRLVISFGRRFIRMVPAARKVAQARTSFLATTPPFTAAECKQSLETSLRELRTDYLDFFLLHDYAVTEAHHEELVAFLESAVKEGKIRFFGIGTKFKEVLSAVQSQPELCRVVQFENSALVRNLVNFHSRTTELLITHGSLGGSYGRLLSFLKTNHDVANSWSLKLGADCSNEDVLAALMLNYAVFVNTKGMVLFSSRNLPRAVSNIESVFQGRFSPEQLSTFGDLTGRLNEIVTGGPGSSVDARHEPTA